MSFILFMGKVTSLSKASLSCSVFCYTEQQSWQQFESDHCSGQHNKSNCQSGTSDTSVLPPRKGLGRAGACSTIPKWIFVLGAFKRIIVYKIKISPVSLLPEPAEANAGDLKGPELESADAAPRSGAGLPARPAQEVGGWTRNNDWNADEQDDWETHTWGKQNKFIRGAHLVITVDLLFYFLVPCYLRWLLPPDSDPCPTDKLSWWNDKAGILLCNSSVPLCITVSAAAANTAIPITSTRGPWQDCHWLTAGLGAALGTPQCSAPLTAGRRKQTNVSHQQQQYPATAVSSQDLWRVFRHPIPMDPKPSWSNGEVVDLPGSSRMEAGALNPGSNLV